MEYLRIDSTFPRLSKSAVTLGKFDGIHRGHRKLVQSILKQKELGAQAVLFAFEVSDKMIMARDERRKLLEELGIDIFLECPLNEKIRHMTAENFIKEILIGDLNVAYVAVGEDFRFGHERKGTPEMLKEFGKKYGFETEILSKEMEGRRKVSSTYIREELKNGNMEKVTALLGMDFTVEGEIVHGRGLGHKVLLPTINIIPSKEKHMPPNGVYLTVVTIKGKQYNGMTNVGYKPTVEGEFLGVETYLFDCNENLYGEKCSVAFKHFQRPEKRFSSLEALKKQLESDAEKAEVYFASAKTQGR